MGGKALKETYTRRYGKEEYHKLEVEVLTLLRSDNIFAMGIPTYSNKESFGDMDLVLTVDGSIDITHIIRDLFKPNQIVKNGNVTSFDYKELQIDLIRFNNVVDMTTARNYFSHGDRGNLLGRISRRLGFKLGHDGLWYVMRHPTNDTQVIGEILLTSSWDSACEFIGYENQRQYDTIEDIFGSVCDSEYFDPGSFNLKFRSHDARVRDRKRPFYNSFLKYLEDHHGLTEDLEPVPLDKEFHMERAKEWFPNFTQELEQKTIQYEKDLKFKKNFNGEIVTGFSGLCGKELGGLMKRIRLYMDDCPEFKEWFTEIDVNVATHVLTSLYVVGVFNEKD